LGISNRPLARLVVLWAVVPVRVRTRAARALLRQLRMGGKDRMRLCVALVLIASALGVAEAQQPPCTVPIRVVTEILPRRLCPLSTGASVSLPELWTPARDLPPSAFIARDGRRRVPIVAVEKDEGPRRIALVALLGGGRAALARRGRRGGQPAGPVGIALRAILSTARPEDSFALLAAGGPRIALPFGSSRDALRAGVDELSHPNPDAPRGPDILKALREAAAWFGSSKTGDSIFLVGALGPKRRMKASQFRSALSGRRVHLFCLGPAYVEEGVADYASNSYSPLVGVAEGSGGAWQELGYRGRGAPDGNPSLWRDEAEALYKMATFSYVLRLPRTGPHVEIQLTDETWHRLRWPRISYPRPLPVCPPPAGFAPAPGQKKK
jgi:hypothetical protein